MILNICIAIIQKWYQVGIFVYIKTNLNCSFSRNLPAIPSCAVKSIDCLLGDKVFCFPCNWDVSEVIVETGDRICCWNWLTIGKVLAATSAAVLGFITVAFEKSDGCCCPFWLLGDCCLSEWFVDGAPIGDVNKLEEQSVVFTITILYR